MCQTNKGINESVLSISYDMTKTLLKEKKNQ